MTKIEEIKDKVAKGHYIFAKESYHGTTWMDHEAEEDVEYLLSKNEEMKKVIEIAVMWLKSNELFIKAIQLQTMLEQIEKDNSNPFYEGDKYAP